MQTQMISSYDGGRETSRTGRRGRGSRLLGRDRHREEGRDRDQVGAFGRPARKDSSATGLGLFSIALGLSQILAPRGFASFIGVGRDPRRSSATRQREHSPCRPRARQYATRFCPAKGQVFA